MNHAIPSMSPAKILRGLTALISSSPPNHNNHNNHHKCSSHPHPRHNNNNNNNKRLHRAHHPRNPRNPKNSTILQIPIKSKIPRSTRTTAR